MLSSALIVAVSEGARLGYRWASLLAALPFISTIALVWMRAEGIPDSRMAEFAIDTFWYVLPTIPMFLVFSLLVTRVGFVAALSTSVIVTLALFMILDWILANQGKPLR